MSFAHPDLSGHGRTGSRCEAINTIRYTSVVPNTILHFLSNSKEAKQEEP